MSVIRYIRRDLGTVGVITVEGTIRSVEVGDKGNFVPYFNADDIARRRCPDDVVRRAERDYFACCGLGDGIVESLSGYIHVEKKNKECEAEALRPAGFTHNERTRRC